MSRGRLSLTLWLYGTAMADVARAGDRVRMTWYADAARRWGLGSRVLSELVPVQAAGAHPHDRRARAFLLGLLAGGNLRDHLAFEAGVEADDVVGMLSAYGRDTAGALVVLPSDVATPEGVGGHEPASEPEIADKLRAAGRYAPDSLESTSLAGGQPKIVLRRDGGRWFRCLGGAASTHILKVGQPEDSPIADVIDTEAASIALARELGLSTIDAVRAVPRGRAWTSPPTGGADRHGRRGRTPVPEPAPRRPHRLCPAGGGHDRMAAATPPTGR